MSSRKGFKILEHTADEYIMAYGDSLEEAFENAALALFEVMTDTDTVESKERENIRIKSEDEISLLHDWLENLLIKFDVERKLYSKFRIFRIERDREGFSLDATIEGEVYDPDKHPSRTDVKAVTYHRLEILKEEGKNTVKFILDI